MITTAGFDRNSICYEQHQKAMEIKRGKLYDPTFYPVVYGADDDADWTDPEVWKKANPSYGITISDESFLFEYEKAKQNPATENNFRRLNLNQWVKQSTRWMPMDLWDKCAFPVDMEYLKGRPCFCGLDLSKTQDMTAFVMVFPPDNPDLDDDDEKYSIIGFYWIPEESLEKRVLKDKVPYDQWQAEGIIEITDSVVVNYNYIQKKILELAEIYDIQEIAFDRWGSSMLTQNLRDAGLTVIDFGQGYASMTQPMEELMRYVMSGRIAHGGCKVLRWNFDNVVVHLDEAGNIKPDKKRVTEKIDAAVATFMAFGRATAREEEDYDPYADGSGLSFFNTKTNEIITNRAGENNDDDDDDGEYEEYNVDGDYF
jgi:phage terminase large subunit-like protein